MTDDTAHARDLRALIERDLDVTVEGRRVPTVLWTPEGAVGPLPIVLVGHGGGGDRRARWVTAMAQGLASEHGIATLAIDGPVNGNRDTNTDEARELRDRDRDEYRRRYYMAKYDEMIADWRGALDVAQALSDVGEGPAGYWGLSMGTRFGLPLVVAEPRIGVAVLGLFGIKPGTEANQRVYDDAPKVAIPVLFLQQLGDQQVGGRASAALFDALGTDDKRLHANLGGHPEVPEDEMVESRRFLAMRLFDSLGAPATASRSASKGS